MSYPFRDQFAQAMDERLFCIEFLDSLLQDGKAFAWFSEKAAIVTEIKTYPTGAKVIEGLVAAGDLDEILKMIERAEAWGKEQGCIMARIESRAGWVRKLKSKGWEVSQTALVKEL